MAATGVDVFDRSIQETNVWLKAFMRELETDDRHLACTALRVTLHAPRDRIGPVNAMHLGAHLPTLIRGLYYEGWHMTGTPTRERHKADFLVHVAWTFAGRKGIESEHVARSRGPQRHVGEG